MANPVGGYEEEESGGITAMLPQLRDPVGVLRRGWLWVVVSALIMGAAGLFGAQFIPDDYKASSRLLMSSKRIPDRFVPSTVRGDLSEQLSEIKNAVLTRRVLVSVLEESGLYREEWEEKSLRGLAGRLSQNVEIDYSSRLHADSIPVRVSLNGGDPEAVASAVNVLVGKMIEANIANRGDQARLATDFMRREFEQADAALRVHQRRLAEFRNTHRGSLPEEQSASIAKLERLELQRRSLILVINELRSRLTTTDAQGNAVVDLEDPDLLALRKRLAQAEAVFTPDHPTVISLRRQIAEFQSAGLGDAGGAAPRVSPQTQQTIAELETAAARLSQIDVEVSRLEGLIETTAEITEEYRGLEREEEILNENYTDYLRKLKDAELSQSLENAQQGGKLTRIEKASVPGAPIVPRWQYDVGAIVLALVCGVLAAVGREMIFPVVIDEAHLESLAGAPVLGAVPRTS